MSITVNDEELILTDVDLGMNNVVIQEDDYEWVVVEHKHNTRGIFKDAYSVVKMVNTTRNIVEFASTNVYCKYLIISALSSIAAPSTMASISMITPLCLATSLPLVTTLKCIEFGVEAGKIILPKVDILSKRFVKPVKPHNMGDGLKISHNKWWTQLITSPSLYT